MVYTRWTVHFGARLCCLRAVCEENKIKHVIYVSRLTDPRGPAAVPEIIRTARAQNAIHGITGALVFDGERFCQYFEGEAEDVDRLNRAIAADRRHAEMQVLSEDEVSTRRFRVWSMAYAFAADSSLIDTISNEQRAGMPIFFENALPRCDLEI